MITSGENQNRSNPVTTRTRDASTPACPIFSPIDATVPLDITRGADVKRPAAKVVERFYEKRRPLVWMTLISPR
jgi:hypothetical protein